MPERAERKPYGGDTPIQRGAWSSHMGAEGGRTFAAGAGACGFAFQHPEGHWEIVEGDVYGMNDIEGAFQPQAVTFPCPVCGDALHVGQERKPFRVGGRRVLRLPDDDGRPHAVILAGPITIDSRLVCGGRGYLPDRPHVEVACPLDVIVYEGMAYQPQRAMGVLAAKMQRLQGQSLDIARRVGAMSKKGYDAPSCEQWQRAVAGTRDSLAPVFARLQQGQYDHGGPGSVAGMWQTLDEAERTYGRFNAELKKMGL